MAEISFLQFPEEDLDGLEEILTFDCFPYWSNSHIYGSDSDPLSSPFHHQLAAVDESDDISFPESSNQMSGPTASSVFVDRKNQVNFVMDLFHQRVEQSHLNEFVSEPVNESNFRVIEENHEMGLNCFDLELGLGLEGIDDDDDDDDDNCAGVTVSECGDEFFVARRENETGNSWSSSRVGGLRMVGIDSDSEDEEGNNLSRIDMHSEEDDYAADNVNDDDVSIPLCWDSLHLEDHREAINDDFEWEEVDGRADEREVLIVVADPDEEGSIAVLPIMGPEEDEGGGERGRGLANLEWEVLLNVNNLERNPEMDNNGGPYFGDNDDYIYTAEYEMMFGQFSDGDNAFMGRPPASKSVIEKLPSVVMTEVDMVKEKALCAVCTDQIEIGEEAKQLPCHHQYHADCILPWLGIRNTCPVCRYELPTDDPDYEQRRVRRAARIP